MSFDELQRAQFDFGKISYREQGSGDALVFLHGLAGNSRSWTGQFKEFASTNRVLAWDAPGYGGSSVIGSDINDFADALATLLDTCGIEQIRLTGHSMGGIVAGRFAGRYPQRVRSLVLSCTFVGGLQPKGQPLQENYQSRLDSFDTLSPAEYGAGRAKGMIPAGSIGATAETLDLATDIASEINREGLGEAARMISEADNREMLTSLTMPVTVLAGGIDPIVPIEKTQEMLDLIPGSQKAIIENTGHACYLEDAPSYNQAIRLAHSLS